MKLTLIEGFEVCAVLRNVDQILQCCSQIFSFRIHCLFLTNLSPLNCALIAEVEEYCRQKQGPYMEDKVSSTCKVELADTRESTVSEHSMKDKVITTKCV